MCRNRTNPAAPRVEFPLLGVVGTNWFVFSLSALTAMGMPLLN